MATAAWGSSPNAKTVGMKKTLYFIALIALVAVASCGSARRSSEDNFYNRHNQLGVKTKDGLFSSRHISFGDYSTTQKESGVDKNIINFSSQRAPFHFSMQDNQGNATTIQAVYTTKKDLENKHLTSLFDSVGEKAEIFYAWIRGGSVNALKNWELIVKNPTYEGLSRGEQVGIFRSLNEVLTVHANNRFGTTGSYDNMCYEFRLKGVPVGAVQLNGDERIWLDKQLDRETRFALAGALSSFLMSPSH